MVADHLAVDKLHVESFLRVTTDLGHPQIAITTIIMVITLITTIIQVKGTFHSEVALIRLILQILGVMDLFVGLCVQGD